MPTPRLPLSPGCLLACFGAYTKDVGFAPVPIAEDPWSDIGGDDQLNCVISETIAIR